jgi:hypothetical protein
MIIGLQIVSLMPPTSISNPSPCSFVNSVSPSTTCLNTFYLWPTYYFHILLYVLISSIRIILAASSTYRSMFSFQPTFLK